MPENNYTITQWSSALNTFTRQLTTAFLQNPQAAFKTVQPWQPRALERILKSYLKDCGVPEYLGECEVCRNSIYTEGLFKGTTDLAHVTEIAYSHWDNTPPNVVKTCYLLTTADEMTAVGLALQVTKETGGYSHIIMTRDGEDSWEITARDFRDHKSKLGPFFNDTTVLYYLLLNFLMHEVCPSSPAKFKISRI